MRITRLVMATGLLLSNGFSAAQEKPYTDATVDKLAGPVRSTLVNITLHESDVHLPHHANVVQIIVRQHCEYDADGTQTLAENPQEGGPYGESMVVRRDAEGHLLDRRTLDRQTGQMTRYERFGPYGVINGGIYSGGKLTDEFIQDWDEHGHRTTMQNLDGQGHLVSRRQEKFTAEGVLLEDTSFACGRRRGVEQNLRPRDRCRAVQEL